MTSRSVPARGAFAACAAAVVAGLLSAPAAAEETDWGWLRGTYDGQIGARYWYGMGSTGKNLYGTDGTTLVSRLTYGGLQTNSVEIFGDINERNYFLKGFAGLGQLMKGSLQDEDFPPAITPYSSTDSPIQSGDLAYATIDAGGYIAETTNSRFGIFLGYNYFRQNLNAFGCTQTAGNPAVCVPTIPVSTAVITQNNDWHSLRLGVNGDVKLGGLRLSGEAAYLPITSLIGTDNHWLRICGTSGCFTGGIPEDGTGWGYQLEAALDYTISDTLTLGIGARYWHMETSGKTHFENRIVGGGGSPQRVDWKTDIFGLTAHAAMRY